MHTTTKTLLHYALSGLVVAGLVVFGFAFGMYAGIKQTFPFPQLVTAYLTVFPRPTLEPTWIDARPIEDAEILDFDPLSIVDIRAPGDVDRLRTDLIASIFGRPDLTAEVRDLEGEPQAEGYMAEAFGDLAAVHASTVEMPLGFKSFYWRLVPKTDADCLFVYQQGHAGSVLELGGEALMRRMLAEGCTVLALQMPQQRENQTLHYIADPDLGPIKIEDHHLFVLLLGKDGAMVGAEGSPIRFFLEPIALALNYELSRHAFSRVGMAGVSGGGWATTVYAAIDPRIQASYPVAGTLPTYLLAPAASFGDFEQNYGPMLRTANYLEMYVMGATGEGRRQVQVLNRFDTCCFHGTYFLHYEEAIRSIAPHFRVYSDSSHRSHQVSPAAIAEIAEDFGSPRQRDALTSGPKQILGPAR